MPLKSATLLSFEVPVSVVLAERTLSTAEVMRLVPGSIVEMAKLAEDDLELYVSNEPVATGTAVKVGENFGLRLTSVGSPRARLEAAQQAADESSGDVAATSAAEPGTDAAVAGESDRGPSETAA